MPAMSFQKRFVPAVELGGLVRELQNADGLTERDALRELRSEFPEYDDVRPKYQTIRARRKDGHDPKPGDTLYLYTGMRTKACRKLGEVRCRSVHRVAITSAGDLKIGGTSAGPRYRQMIAKADGFEPVHQTAFGEMLAWFERVHGLPFRGVLIRW